MENNSLQNIKHKIPLKHQICTAVSFTENFNMPIVSPYHGPIPESIISFNRARASKSRVCGVHFFISDSFFECVWNAPKKYLSMLKTLPWVISPDFSLYSDMLKPEVMWNTFRNKLLAAWWQKNGVPVIPNVSWWNSENMELCLEGEPTRSVIAINSTGLHRDRRAKSEWRKGYEKVIKTLNPIHILRYGAKQDGEYETISTYYPNDNSDSSGNGR